MKRFLFGLVALLLGTPCAVGQIKRFELFVGYSPLRNFEGATGLEQGNTMHGWDASLLGNVNSWLGITADFTGHYNGRAAYVGIIPDNGAPV